MKALTRIAVSLLVLAAAPPASAHTTASVTGPVVDVWVTGSRYDGMILSLRQRFSRGVDLSASYTAAKATSDGPVQQGPSARTDSRHTLSISGIVRAPGGVDVAPVGVRLAF